MELQLQGSCCFVTTSSANLAPAQEAKNALLLSEILFFSVGQGWDLLSEQVSYSGAIFQQKLLKLVTAVTMTETLQHMLTPHQASSLLSWLFPSADPVRHSMRCCQSKQGSHSASKPKPTPEQSCCSPGAGPGHTASPHRPHSLCLITQAGTVPRCSLLNRPWCKVCLRHLLQGASSHLCCSPRTKGSERGQAAGSPRRIGPHCFKKIKIGWSHANNTTFPSLSLTKAKLLNSLRS